MDSYFLSIIDRLTFEEIDLLNHLTKKDSTNVLTSIKKKELQSESKMSDATFRKTLNRLEAMLFINTVTGNKEHSIYATEYGQEAIQVIYERSNN